MSKTMEDVLAAHMDVIYVEGHGDTDCCHDIAELAEALSTAGFGNLHDAWEKGYSNCSTYHQSGGLERTQDNPYPAPKVSES